MNGTYTKEQALKKILEDTQLSYRVISANSITLEKRAVKKEMLLAAADNIKSSSQPSNKTAIEEPTVLETVNVTDKAKHNVTDPYNPDYTLPNATAGTKTDTPIMETPLNVQVISKQVLKDQQVISIDQAVKNVSGILNNPANTGGLSESYTLRGFQSQTLFRNGFRIDNNDVGSGSQQLANVESLEILKGPAAILFGRVEPGGLINLVTKQPLSTPYYSLQQQIGSYNLYRTSLDATSPITKDDTLLYRLNMSYENSGSFRQQVKNERIFIAPVLKWNISPKTQVTFEMEYNNDHVNYDQITVPFVDGQVKKLPRHLNLTEGNPQKDEIFFGGVNWSHQFNDDWAVKHSISIHRLEKKFSGTSLPLFFLGADQAAIYPTGFGSSVSATYATDINLTGRFDTFGLKHTLLLGGDYYRTDYSTTSFAGTSLDGVGFSVIDINNPNHPGSSLLAPDPQSKSKYVKNVDNYGFYIQDQIKLPYNIYVMGGIRYQYIHQKGKTTNLAGDVTQDAMLTADAVTPRVGLLWQAQDWLSLYGNYTENFGSNSGLIFPNKAAPPSSAQQWEFGTKTEFFGGRLRATLAYFDLTKQNVVTNDPDLTHVCGGSQCSLVTGEIHSRGPELDIQGEILPGWNVIATYANRDVRIAKSNNGDIGNRLWNSPRNMGSLWSTYDFRQGELHGFKMGAGVTLRDSVTDQSNTVRSPGYATVDLLAAYHVKVGKSKITAQFNVNNLLDRDSFTTIAAVPSLNTAQGSYLTPRTFMGSIKIEY